MRGSSGGPAVSSRPSPARSSSSLRIGCWRRGDVGAEVASAAARGESSRAPASATALALALGAIAALEPSLDPGPASPFRHLYGAPPVAAGLRFGPLRRGPRPSRPGLLPAPR